MVPAIARQNDRVRFAMGWVPDMFYRYVLCSRVTNCCATKLLYGLAQNIQHSRGWLTLVLPTAESGDQTSDSTQAIQFHDS